jgi:hypothetical protein
VLEHRGELRGGRRGGRHRLPEQEQVVVVEDVLLPFPLGVGPEDLPDPLRLVEAPGVPTFQHVGERLTRVHGPRIDRGERVLAREASLAGRVSELVAQEVHHVGTVGLVEDGEVGGEAERAAVEAQQPVADRVERPTPDAAGLARTQAGRPRDHLASRPPAEREQKDALGPRAPFDQGGDSRCQRHRLSAARSGDDQQGALAVTDGGLLLRVQLLEHAFEG